MRFTTISCLVAALYSASAVLADAVQAEASRTVIDYAEVTPEPELLDQYGNRIELRQATQYNAGAKQVPTQAGAVTTFYMQSAIGSTVTYAEFIYTQTFAKVPDQLPTVASGSIGLGTLVKQNKRDAAPTPNGDVVQPVMLVVEIQNVMVVHPLQPVVQVTEIIMVPPNGAAPGDSTLLGPLGFNLTSLNHTMFNNQTNWNRTNATTAAGTARFTFPSEMGPAGRRPPLTQQAR